MSVPARIEAAFLAEPQTGAVLAALGDGEAARFVGGCVRNALLGLPVSDIDIATPLEPTQVIARLSDAAIKAVATGLDHGTVTAIVDGRPFEITSLRKDVETDGRHATVAFTRDWAEDAARRDFTMNALYADGTGRVFDPTGEGLADLAARRVRFIGDARARIREDFLRILRFFRFHAFYGRGELDAEGLAAATAERDGLRSLSAERVQKELLRLLEAEDPVPALAAMAQAGILAALDFPPVDLVRLARLVAIEREEHYAGDAVRRFAALVEAGEAGARNLAQRLRFSNEARERLAAMKSAEGRFVPWASGREVRRLVYRLGTAAFRERALLAWAGDGKATNAAQWRALIAIGASWVAPILPLSGADVMAAGVPQGPAVGRVLTEVEEWWIDNDFPPDRFALVERMKAVVRGMAF
ncbi:MAG: CCA tRNA nucleotidyltransferase [Alphaproteobacteria bacterium]|nr:CCA tRNA nucleotidyltransferase [Alphaproteobacteria bacterium]